MDPAGTSRLTKLLTVDGLTKAARVALDASPCLAYFVHRSGDITYANRSFAEIIGDAPSLGVGLALAVHSDDLDRVITLRESVLSNESETSFEVRLKATDGEWVKLAVHHWPAYNSSGDFCGGLAAAINVDCVKRAEDIRFSSLMTDNGVTQEAGAVFDLLPMHIYMMRADGKVAYVNQAVSDYFGDTEVTDAGWAEVVHPDDLGWLASMRETVSSGGGDVGTELRVRRPDGSYGTLATHAYVARDASGELIGWLGFSFEIDGISRAD